MSTIARFAIVIALAAVVAGVLVMKNRTRQSSPAPNPPSATAQPQAATPAAGLPRLVDLGADKCIPCKMMAPILEELRAEMAGKLDVVFLDVWKNPDVGKAYGIKLIPTQIFYDASGKELFRHEGFFAKPDILAKWKELGVNLDTGMPTPATRPTR